FNTAWGPEGAIPTPPRRFSWTAPATCVGSFGPTDSSFAFLRTSYWQRSTKPGREGNSQVEKELPGEASQLVDDGGPDLRHSALRLARIVRPISCVIPCPRIPPWFTSSFRHGHIRQLLLQNLRPHVGVDIGELRQWVAGEHPVSLRLLALVARKAHGQLDVGPTIPRRRIRFGLVTFHIGLHHLVAISGHVDVARAEVGGE